MNKNTSISVTNSFFWRLFERIGAQGVTIVVSIILARLLGPSVYGEIALVTVIIAILQVFVDAGLGSSLIQKKDADDLDFCSVFVFNIFACTILYLSLFFLAPLICSFFGYSDLVIVIRVLGITILISGIKNIQQAYVARNMLFKHFFFATLTGTIIAAVVGIVMAYRGFGIWSLVVQLLTNTAIDTIILWLTIKWKPKLKFSFKKFASLLKYGWKLMLSSFLETIYNESYQLIIGKKFSAEDLAYFNQGKKLPNAFVSNINASIDSIVFPVMSKSQDDTTQIKTIQRKVTGLSTYCVWPALVGMFFCGDSLIRVLLGLAWIDSVFYLRVCCVCFLFYPLYTANLNALKAVGRSDLFFGLEIAKKIAGVLIILCTIWFGLKIFAIGMIIEAFASLLVNTFFSKKIIGYSLFEQLKDLFPNLLINSVMGACVFIVGLVNNPSAFTLLKQIIIGVLVYFTLSFASKNKAYEYVAYYLKRVFGSKKTN